MNGTKLITVAALIVVSLGATCLAQDPPKKTWVWLTKQGVWGYGYQIEEGPAPGPLADRPRHETGTRRTRAHHRPLWLRRDLESVPCRGRTGPPWLTTTTFPPGPPKTTLRRTNRGIGHHVTINCFQNCAWNTPDAASTAEEWMNSRGHRANMLTPSATRFGIAFGPGPYWTMNAE